MPFSPGGHGSIAGPLLVKMFAKFLDFGGIGRAQE
jgi:hypothetical protein